jgi:hypothetical protein
VRYGVLTKEVVGLNERSRHRKDRERREPPDRREKWKLIFSATSITVALARFLWDLARS